jgi:ATP-dependent helicase HrpB
VTHRPSRIPLPVDDVLPAVRAALAERTGLVVAAPPGAGKTTRVPPAIATVGEISGRVVLLEPRRLAAIAAARRIAEESGVALGHEIGHQVRFDRRWGRESRVVVATEGILVQWLLHDPLLEGVGCIVFDEVHERNVATDQALAMALRLREVREELRLVAMSATLDAGRFAALLGDRRGEAPVVRCAARSHPVEVRFAPRADERALEARAAGAIRSVLRELDATPGGEDAAVLAFFPGVGEIERCAELLRGGSAPGGEGSALDVPVLPLHGSLDLDRQAAALRGAGRRVVLATNVAESSVTVEGVRAVVDTGAERILRFDPATGLDRLELAAISRASADQRAGRAGRNAPGTCVRLWTASEHAARAPERQPEIQRVDLASTVLALRAWGEEPAGLRWPDPPTAAQLALAGELLAVLGALEAGRVTERGHRMATLPLHPRLAALALFAQQHGIAAEGAVLAALLAERDPFRPASFGEAEGLSDLRSDALERWLAVADGGRGRPDPRLRRGAARRVLQAAEQIAASMGARGGVERLRTDPGTQELLLRALLAAYPDRVARRREERSERAVMVGGHGVRLSPASRVRTAPLFVCLAVGGASGRAGGRETVVHSASAVEAGWLATRTEEAVELEQPSGRVVIRRRTLYRDLPLAEVEAGLAPPERAAPVLEAWAARDVRAALGLERPEIAGLLARVACLREWRPELGLPDLALPEEKAARNERVEPVAALTDEPGAPEGGQGRDREGTGRVGEGAGREAGTAAAGGAPAEPVLPGSPLAALPPPWADVVRAACAGARSTADLQRAPLLELLHGVLPWRLRQQLDELAPARLELPSGRTAAIEYRPGQPPVLAARIQDLFGWRETPRIAGGRVPLLLHLLAPNFRPQQVTDDLAGFWQRTYPMVRKELAGRYPKHAWPEDGASAQPLRGRQRGGSR